MRDRNVNVLKIGEIATLPKWQYFPPGLGLVSHGNRIPEGIPHFKMAILAVGVVSNRLADQSAVGAVNRPLLWLDSY